MGDNKGFLGMQSHLGAFWRSIVIFNPLIFLAAECKSPISSTITSYTNIDKTTQSRNSRLLTLIDNNIPAKV